MCVREAQRGNFGVDLRPAEGFSPRAAGTFLLMRAAHGHATGQQSADGP